MTPGIHDRDHRGVMAKVRMDIPAAEPVQRRVYNFKKANWNQLKGSLLARDWRGILAGSADDAAADITQVILDTVAEHIPMHTITDKVYAHPWLDDTCRLALQRRNDAEGTPNYNKARDECSQTFLEARSKHAVKVRNDLKGMSVSSRGWWRLAGSLLARAGTRESIPPLQRADESWALSAADKATELARVFQSKSQLPPQHENEYSTLLPSTGVAMRSGFLRLRVRTVYKLLKKLDEKSGTGPDLLPARILKMCARELALPVTLLARKLLREHRWPLCWREHWIHGIFKRGSRALGKNYRGVHLTPQLSKVVERSLGTLFIPWLESSGAYGPNQFAYSKGKGHKDTLTINVCNWLLLLEQGYLVAVYCSDVSGAFDRVSRERLCDKLRTLGLHDDVIGFLLSWLEERASTVVLGGRRSELEALADSVYQGTVLGSPLWNVFYADSRRPLQHCGYTETAFADDLNCWKAFPRVQPPAGEQGPLLTHGPSSRTCAPYKESFTVGARPTR